VTFPRWAAVLAAVVGVAFILATRWSYPWLSAVVVVCVVILLKAGQLLGVRFGRRER